MSRPENMQALVLRQDGFSGTTSGLAITDLDALVALDRIAVPTPGPGQVLIKVALAPVNPSDLHFLKGEYGQPRRRGTPAGFEGTGTVVAAADARAADLVGRRVSFLASASGSWAEYALTDAGACVEVGAGVRDEDAAALLVNPLTAVAMIALVATAGARAVVLTAAGSQLGRMLLGLARERGIAPIAVVRSAGGEASLRALGAAAVLVSGEPEFAARLDAVLRVERPRVLLDAVGDQTAADIFLAMPAHSRWISYGMLSAAGPCLPQMGAFVFSGKRIEGFWLSRWLHTATSDAIAAASDEVQRQFLSGAWHTRVCARVRLGDALRDLPGLLARPGKVMLVPSPHAA
ncbi:MAG: alcohol dehydrogenase catalytic domain-containing protein [Burkholderiaceae bacterium]|nr:alcohol dehydrogenase catalytic domain-containing protein [Burkholderiaceae bacterium]